MSKEDIRIGMRQAMDLLEELYPDAGFVIVGARNHDEEEVTQITTVDNMDPDTVRDLFEICLEGTDFQETSPAPQRQRMH